MKIKLIKFQKNGFLKVQRKNYYGYASKKLKKLFKVMQHIIFLIS